MIGISIVSLAILIALGSLPLSIAAHTPLEAQRPLGPPVAPTATSWINEEPAFTSAAGQPKPFYKIAHQVLTRQGARVAIQYHGANAMEIDMTAWESGWWADHDGRPGSQGDPVVALFPALAHLHRTSTSRIRFVWLDIKTADRCDPDNPLERHCSIDALRDVARNILLPAGIRVLYGFYNSNDRAYKRVRDSLVPGEAINLDGRFKDIEREFTDRGPPARFERVMSSGAVNFTQGFGNCHETSDLNGTYTCSQLRRAVKSQDFGRVFGWTSAAGQADYVDMLLEGAYVDGLIYGFPAAPYTDHLDTRAASDDISTWIAMHKDLYYLATEADLPW